MLHKRVIGQEEAVSGRGKGRQARPCRAEESGSVRSVPFCFWDRPVSERPSFQRRLAEAVFGDEQAMIRVDMSEYMEKHSVSTSGRLTAGICRIRGGRSAHVRRCGEIHIR